MLIPSPRRRRLSFMDSLVLSIAADEKTVTRRLAREVQPVLGHSWAPCLCREIDPSDRPCLVCSARYPPPMEAGDVIDVCEALTPMNGVVCYRADSHFVKDSDAGMPPLGFGYPQIPGVVPWPWKVRVLPARYCPTWAVRHHLEVVSVRPEPLTEIDDADAAREGIARLGWPVTAAGFLAGFRQLHGLAADADPVVHRIEFRRLPC